jgi:hypothetical protein
MKKAYFFISFFIFQVNCFSQNNYTFSSANGSYNSIETGIAAPLSPAFSPAKSDLDEGFSNNIPIGFSFQYNGKNYSAIHLNTNGFATLGAPFMAGAGQDPTYESNELRSASGQKGVIKPVLAPFWDNLILPSAGSLTYSSTGTAPNRIFIAQWKNAIWQSGGSAISFQLKLYETSNIIEFQYQPETDAGGANKSASIGISSEFPQILDEETAPLTYQSLTSSTASAQINTLFETDNIATKPASGQIFRFTPNPCMPPSGILLNGYNSNSANLSWTALQGNNTYEIALSNIDVQPNSGTALTANQFVYSNLSENTTYYFYIKNSCGSIWNKFIFTTTALATLPYTEDFETVLENSIPENMTRQTLNNPFGDSFWQGTDLLNAASGTKKMISTSPFVPSKAWLFTPSFTLLAGGNYNLTYKISTTGGPINLDVKYGTKAGQDFMTTNIATDNNISNTNYITKTINFSPTASGEHTIGFANKSAANNQILLLDDISFTLVSAPLPLNLISFKAKLNQEKQTELNWETSAERNVSHFEIEKSIDGKMFDQIGKTYTQNTGNEANNYDYLDRNTNIGLNYYRLKMVDKDGKYSFSPLEYVNLKENFITELYPNPSYNEVYLKMKNTDKVILKAFSLDGRELPINYSLINNNEFKIKTESAAITGIYLLNITSPTETRILKWVIK